MTKIALTLAAGLALAGGPAAAEETSTKTAAVLEFSTKATGGKYQPKHVLAVWIADARSNLVATLEKRATKRQKYLTAWNAARGTNVVVDGVSGATMQAHAPHTAAWNGLDAAGKPAPDGPYFFVVEFTDFHGQGPLALFPFTKGPGSPAASRPDGGPHIKDVTLRINPATAKQP